MSTPKRRSSKGRRQPVAPQPQTTETTKTTAAPIASVKQQAAAPGRSYAGIMSAVVVVAILGLLAVFLFNRSNAEQVVDAPA
ncbi:MAG: hypothetical protein HC893_12010 [Chloroflexaceae bacterium]|nr:hypothetical protein [Chloroflexaceae bacterium]